MKSTYTPAEAAEFLKISEAYLEQLTAKGNIRQCAYRGKKYYLGGELDSVRSGLLFSAQKARVVN